MKKAFTYLTILFLGLLGTFQASAQAPAESPASDTLFSPVYAYEYIPDFTYAEVASRVEALENGMPFELNKTIYSFINYFTVRNREYTKMIMARVDFYFPIFEEALKRHGLPDELKYLAIIESGLNPKARSRVGAVGLWQFMPATGRAYGLNNDFYMDDRMDPYEATEAACKYLKSLYSMFGNWELALASYNAGPGNVRKAIRRSGYKKTFWEVYNYLPRETRSYVPQFQAMIYVLKHAEDHHLFVNEIEYPGRVAQVNLNSHIDLEKLSLLTDICLEDIQRLNPSLKSTIIPEHRKSYTLNIPADKQEFLVSNLGAIKDSLKVSQERLMAVTEEIRKSSPYGDRQRSTYTVRSGDFLGRIAQRYGVSVATVKEWNNLSSNTIRVGQRLVVYEKINPSTTTNTVVAQRQLPANATSPDGKYYTVQPGDSLWLISKRFPGLTIDKIKELNNLNTSNIKPGQKLKIG